MNKQVLREQIDDVIQAERAWRDHYDKQDKGSYCENSSREAREAYRVMSAWRALLGVLIQYENGTPVVEVRIKD